MTHIERIVLLGISILVVAGCATSPTRLEADYGSAYHAARTRQMLPPATEKAVQPAAGFDGEAALATIDRYRQQFAQPSPPPRFVLPVGTVK